MKNKWKWSETTKGTPYKILSESIESNQFLGYSFALINPALTMKNIHQIELQFEDLRQSQESHINFAIGITHMKYRAQKGYDQ
jgi:hypothetical protein